MSEMNPARIFLASVFLLFLAISCKGPEQSLGTAAPKPLFRDPVYDGAADPVVVWNDSMQKHVMYYTNRRASAPGAEGVSWVHGTRIGVAVSADGGSTWTYLDTCDIGYRPDAEPTYWAPEVLVHQGLFHMYLSYVPGIFKDWGHPRHIVHLSSSDGLAWSLESPLELASDKVIDACVYPLPEGGWRMWYNNERDKKSMYHADSPDLYTWTDRGKTAGIGRGEGAKVFSWKDAYWMLVDEWRGLGVYRSKDLENWVKQDSQLLSEPGLGADDGVIGQHCDVVVEGERAFVFYFTHPGRLPDTPATDTVALRRSSIQVAELLYSDSLLSCDRDAPVFINLGPEP